MKAKKFVLLFLVVISTALYSCADELDFNQVDNYNPTPTYEAGIFYLEIPEDLINSTNTSNFDQQFRFDAFSSEAFASRVLEGVVTYEVENTTSKAFDILVEFLNAEDEVLDTESLRMNAAPSAVSMVEISYGPAGRSIDIIKSLSKIKITAENLGDNSSTSTVQNAKIKLRSSGAFRVQLKK